ncbi:hypothetical protein V6Z11_D04G175100 [Gossypium hirsutum]
MSRYTLGWGVWRRGDVEAHVDLARRRYTRADATCARRRPGSAAATEAVSETARVSTYALGSESGLSLGTRLRFGPLGWCWVIGYSG